MNMGLIINMMSGVINGSDPEDLAIKVERVVRRRGGDPVEVYQLLQELAVKRLAALGKPVAEPEPAQLHESCGQCGRWCLVVDQAEPASA